MIEDILQAFASPGAAHRGAPFWAWNGRLDPEELRRQIRLMKRMGLGGFFMHSRIGLATPYLSEEWFACVEACVDEARALGMVAWLYDEDRWPSGAAGGLVTKDERWRERSLVMEAVSDPGGFRWGEDVVAAFAATVEGTAARGVRRIARGSRPARLAAGERILAFRVVVDAPSDWYNGATYLDTLNPLAVKRFISVTHEAYRRRFGDRFGSEIPGIFTDEPCHAMRLGGPTELGLPWTRSIPSVFRARYGYDLLPRLVELYYDVEGAPMSRARWHYHDCVTHLFVDSFGRQIGQWCGEHGLAFTGHLFAEDTLSRQTQTSGSCMRFYEHMQAPGMDLLTEHRRAVTTAKQVASVARQFGRRWRLSETYGCTGWDFPFLGHKAIGDLQAALGINYRCQHLAWYTMGGEAKRDYPAAISWQSPWWEMYPKVEDYFARLNAVLMRGVEVRDLLVVHPVESAWTMVRVGWMDEPRVKAFDMTLVSLEDSLLGAHIDFDYADEDILSRTASVAKREGRPTLRVGKASYSVVLVPPLLTVRSTTLALLKRFREAGGRVVFAGEPAAFVDAVPSDAARRLAASSVNVPPSGPELAAAVEPARRVEIRDRSGNEIGAVLYQLREEKGAFILFACNTGRAGAGPEDIFEEPGLRDRPATFSLARIRILAPTPEAPLELDPAEGTTWQADAIRGADGTWTASVSLPRQGSCLLLFPTKPPARAYPSKPRLADARQTELDGGRWETLLSEENVLPLDRPRIRIAQRDWLAEQEVLRADRVIRESLGLPLRGEHMVQPWCRTPSRDSMRSVVELAYHICVDTIPAGPLFLCVEQPWRWEATLNGATLPMLNDCGWWVDPSLRRIPVDPALLHEGSNDLTLRGEYGEDHPGLEIVYLLGRFGVTADGASARIIEEPRALSLGDWVPQGLAFYSGSVTYRRKLTADRGPDERVFLRVPEYRGAAVRVMIDGRCAGVIAWEPNEIDITACLPAGERIIDLGVEVVGHRRNSHGPLHNARKWPNKTGPREFVTSGADWSEPFQLVPCGLLQPPVIVTRKPAKDAAG